MTRQSTINSITKTARNTNGLSNTNTAVGLKTLKDNLVDTDEEIEMFQKEYDDIKTPTLTQDQLNEIRNSCILTLDLNNVSENRPETPTVSDNNS